ncbi:MAG: tripartite tricarboxylate transporter substrate binding protein [Methylobacterium sp.]|nr:tripartite tricarboxylate transporter substrate binding protein [Methylobacterium sp.]MCA3596934.1 tripartite tricarboxylate transporter substrate binding protein [Methylobacterium sp.]MCA3602066.1 tripartite tricarboxylate transporter substrate binding protein [Methylobacterium sp.]MCA3607635.1 tripartite tricarboxylate transporter substrate binding protein [Methylobacterium sp.]MCA3610669.1 tripartite tricarboxylate transporter substrate binding protein [Methylobacterium sp.]
MLNRRQTLACAGAAVAFPFVARAQSGFPSRTITIVVAYPAGGPTDVIARIVAANIEEDLKQKVIVENRAGASGSIGTRAVAQAEPDGHTITFGNNQTHGNNMLLMKQPGYDAIADFAPLAGAGAFPHALVVRNDLPVKNLQELIALAKREPGKLNYGSTGNGSGSHLSTELLMRRVGIQMQHIPYQGAAPLVQDIIGGRIDVSLSTLPSVLKQIEAGQMRGIGVASTRRASQLPNMPTFREQGVSNADAESWAGFFAPAKTPAPVVDRLSRAIIKAMQTEAVSRKITDLGFALDIRPPAEFRAFLKQEMETWADVVKAIGLQPV